MHDDRLTDQQRAMVRSLLALAAERAEREKAVEETYRSGNEAADAAYEDTKQSLSETHRTQRRAADQELQHESERLEREYQSDRESIERTYKLDLAEINEKAEQNRIATKKALQEAIWLAETVYEATETQPTEKLQQARKGIDGRVEELQQIEEQVTALLKRYRQRHATWPPNRQAQTVSTPPQDNPLSTLDAAMVEAQRVLEQLRRSFVARLFIGIKPWLWIIVAGAIGGTIAAWQRNWNIDQGVWTFAGVGAGVGTALLVGLYFLGRAQTARLLQPLRQAIESGRAVADQCIAQAEAECERLKAELIAKRDSDIRLAHQKYDPILEEIRQRQQHYLERINEKYPRLLSERAEQYEQRLQAFKDRHRQRTQELDQTYEQEIRALEQQYTERKQKLQEQYDTQWQSLETKWKQGMAAAYATADHVTRQTQRLFPAWDDESWRNWQPPTEFSPVVRFGSMSVDLHAIPGGLPTDERLIVPGPERLELPAMLAFPDHCSVLIKTGEEGREQAVQTLQTIMFRLLTTIPPGKVRFTILDPVGLGQNFAGFMHLADYEGAFVAEKIWTEDRHIEQRLLDLTEHMENVIQKYLRNEYETIGDYNKDAGEIAEPFRFLVIANFPVNFSETAARRLASIVNSGARCGVYTLITVDTRLQLPSGFQLADLERNSLNLVYDNGRFVWRDDDYAPFPLSLDEPPDEAFVTEKLHAIGEAAKSANRVEVPFEVIVPAEDEFWSQSTDHEVRVPLGRCGATKLQYLSLGQGTSQHALIAGKTGSGKSTLLHALITNLSLWYSPDEVEFYLVDFKKGVEFKTYATHQLPHARVVAIESDREFGLSVLQRLDAELKRRGNLFRDLGVQDLAAYRRSGHPEKLPRTLLIIDEFQELFTEDDKLGQDAALLLDRLVRQGRAFGMHVLLGSQTLGGAYSLARSTIGQMAVRIALQCSEADSYLILSDDNAAARLLARPGEAIYNDASGMIEGNSPFQVVWLPDEKREQYLQRVAELAKQHEFRRPEPQIVFEGNVPALLDRNHLLSDLLSLDVWLKSPSTSMAWLGEAIAIKDPTAAMLGRQSGHNLLIVGQRDESALAMMASSLISLAAQHAPGNAKFFLLDGSPVDAPNAGYLERIAAALPHGVQNVSYRDVPTAMNDIAEELERRQQANESDAPPIFLLIYGLQRFRMLRQEEDFGFSSSEFDPDAPPKPEKQFAAILREGPAVGIHTLAWCDTANNVSRSLDRQGLREFEIRVLFQMGAADSSNLIDSPAAAKLGLHRAIFFSEELGQLEKFRPYALPDDYWLERVSQIMNQRAVAQPFK